MTFSPYVVQAKASPSQPSGVFSDIFAQAVTAGSTVFIAVLTFNASNVAISSASPTLGGSPVAGTVKLAEVQSAFSVNTAYAAIWMLPNVAGGATSFGITVTNPVLNNAQSGMAAWEIAGLGPSPVLDVSSTSSGAGISATSGTTAAATRNIGIILGALIGIGGLPASPGAPAGYVNFNIGTAAGASVVGSAHQSSAGSTYTYATNNNSTTDSWAGAVAAIIATGSPAQGAPGGLVARRRPITAVWGGYTSSLAVTPPPVSPPGSVQPLTTVPVPRRYPSRALWHWSATGTNAQPVAVAAPRQLIVIPRRYPSRAVYRGYITPGSQTALGPGAEYQAGLPGTRWQASSPQSRWAVGRPQ